MVFFIIIIFYSLLIIWLSKDIFSVKDSFALIFLVLLFLSGWFFLLSEFRHVSRPKVTRRWPPWLSWLITLKLSILRFNKSIQILNLMWQGCEVELNRRVSMVTVLARGADHTLHPSGFRILEVVLHDGIIDVVFALGLHVNAVLFVSLFLLDAFAHFDLFLFHFDWVSVIVD